MTTSAHTPLRVAIIGGSGKVSRELITQLRSRGDDAVAIIRDAAKAAALTELGAIPVVLDIEHSTERELAEVLAGADVVVFAAGAGGGDPARTRAVDYDGAVLAMAAASAASVERFVMVSALGAGGPLPTEGSMVAYYEAKHDADATLMTSALDWTILRPGSLTDDEPTGLVELAPSTSRGSIPRADVASVIVAVIDDGASAGRVWELVSGTRSITDALQGQN